jgi:hypothetical protein
MLRLRAISSAVEHSLHTGADLLGKPGLSERGEPRMIRKGG